jgi:hypothetical protein
MQEDYFTNMQENEQQIQSPDQSLRKKLNGMFTRYNYVGVKNPLKITFSWAVALEQNEILGMDQAEAMNEERMAQSSNGTFLPLDGVVRGRQKITRVVLQPNEKKMIPGEAAYVVVPRLFHALVREKYGTTKSALAKLRNPTIQAQLIPLIVEGPVINNIGQAMQTYVNTEMKKVEGFTDVQTQPANVMTSPIETVPHISTETAPALKGWANPEVQAKAKATREARKAAATQPAN